MDFSNAVLGSSVVKYLRERRDATVLQIGKDRFDRATLAGVACFHFVAAANLSKVLNAELRVRDTRDVFDNVSPERLVLPRLGAVSLAVLGAAFEARGLGGSEPLTTWFRKHRDSTVTFHALKAHAANATATNGYSKSRKGKQ